MKLAVPIKLLPTPDEAAAGKVEGAYAWDNDLAPADPPEWLLALLARPQAAERGVGVAAPYAGPSPYWDAAATAELARLENAVDGTRNETLNRVAFALGQMAAAGFIDPEPTYETLEALVAYIGDNPEKDESTLVRGWEAGMLEPRAAPVQRTAEDVLGDAPPPMPSDAVVPVPLPPALPDAPTEGAVPGSAHRTSAPVLNSEIPKYFEGVWYIADLNKFYIAQTGALLSRQSFDGAYSGPVFYLDAANSSSGKTRSPVDAVLRCETWTAPRLYALEFRPDQPPVFANEDGLLVGNSYRPQHIQRMEGDATSKA